MRWLDSLPKRERSAEIRRAIEAYLDKTNGLTLADIYHAISSLEQKIGNGIVLAAYSERAANEPPDIANTLDNLGVM